MREVWQRLYDKVKHMSDKLVDMRKNDDLPEGSKAKTRFHESTIENVRDLCAILPRLNFTDDPDLEAMRQRVEESLASVEVEAIKTDRSFREHTATEAQNILSAMATFMGGQ
jgi:predicted secreted Zn-dependent protease